MTEVSLLGGGEATGQTKQPCLYRREDDHVSGLPFICILDKGHDGNHSDQLDDDDAPEIACTECRGVYAPSAKFRTNWRVHHLTDGLMNDEQAMIRAAMAGDDWVTVDENENRVRICPKCVDRLKVEKARATCPDWCTSDHANDNLPGGDWWFLHAGPDFGPGVRVEQPSSSPEELNVVIEEAEWTITEPSDVASCAAQLREIAAALSSAAEWLEAS